MFAASLWSSPPDPRDAKVTIARHSRACIRKSATSRNARVPSIFRSLQLRRNQPPNEASSAGISLATGRAALCEPPISKVNETPKDRNPRAATRGFPSPLSDTGAAKETGGARAEHCEDYVFGTLPQFSSSDNASASSRGLRCDAERGEPHFLPIPPSSPVTRSDGRSTCTSALPLPLQHLTCRFSPASRARIPCGDTQGQARQSRWAWPSRARITPPRPSSSSPRIFWIEETYNFIQLSLVPSFRKFPLRPIAMITLAPAEFFLPPNGESSRRRSLQRSTRPGVIPLAPPVRCLLFAIKSSLPLRLKCRPPFHPGRVLYRFAFGNYQLLNKARSLPNRI